MTYSVIANFSKTKPSTLLDIIYDPATDSQIVEQAMAAYEAKTGKSA